MLAAILLSVAALTAWLVAPDRSWPFLEARYLESPTDVVDLDGWRLHVRVRGVESAPAVILIHGFASSLQTWDAWVDDLARTHRIVSLDLPGSGLSRPDPAADYTDARSVQLLLALMDRLGLQRASLVGHSIGGRIAWTFAAAHPERVDRLVLVAPDGYASPGFAYGRAPEVPVVFGLLRSVLPKALLRKNLEAAYADPETTLTDARVDRYDDLIRAPGGRQALLDRMRQTVLVDPNPRLASIRAPTLLLWGELDRMIPPTNAADYLKALPNARLVTFPGTGHLPQEEAGSASLAVVEAFLAP